MNKALREKLEREQHAFDTDAAWQKFEPTLDRDKRRFGFWWFFGAVTLAFFLGAATVYCLFVPSVQSEVFVDKQHDARLDQQSSADDIIIAAAGNQENVEERGKQKVTSPKEAVTDTHSSIHDQKWIPLSRVSESNVLGQDKQILIETRGKSIEEKAMDPADQTGVAFSVLSANDEALAPVTSGSLFEKGVLVKLLQPELKHIDQLSLKLFPLADPKLPYALRVPKKSIHNAGTGWTLYALGGVGYELLRADLPADEVLLNGITSLETASVELGVSKALAQRWSLTGLLMTSQRNEEFTFQSTQTNQQLLFNPASRFINGVAQGDSTLAEVSTTRTIKHYNKLNRLDVGAVLEYNVPTRICAFSIYGGMLYAIQSDWTGKRQKATTSELTISENDLYQSINPMRVLFGTRSSSAIGKHLDLLIDANAIVGSRYSLRGEFSETSFTQKGTAFNVRIGLGYKF